MCGRITKASEMSWRELWDLMHLEPPTFEAHYNIAPSMIVPVIRVGQGEREIAFMQSGLVPSWAKPGFDGSKTFNAKCETVAIKPSYRDAFKRRRCIIPANGYYEWDAKTKRPYYFQPTDFPVFPFAGLWVRWEGPDGEVIESCTIITTEANKRISPIHHRMPVILGEADWDEWLLSDRPEDLHRLMGPTEGVSFYEVSSLVNSPRNNSPKCIEPGSPAQGSLF